MRRTMRKIYEPVALHLFHSNYLAMVQSPNTGVPKVSAHDDGYTGWTTCTSPPPGP